MTTVPPILKGLPSTQAQAVLAAFEEDGIYPTSLDMKIADALLDKGYLQRDAENFLVVTPRVRRALELKARL